MGRKGKGHVPAPISSFISTEVIICIRKCSRKSQCNKLIRAFHISSKENQVSCLTTQQAASLAKDFRECSALSFQTRQLLIELLPRARLRSAGRWLASSQLFLFQGIALDLQPLNNLTSVDLERGWTERVLWALSSPGSHFSCKEVTTWGTARVPIRIHLGISNGCAIHCDRTVILPFSGTSGSCKLQPDFGTGATLPLVQEKTGANDLKRY